MSQSNQTICKFDLAILNRQATDNRFQAIWARISNRKDAGDIVHDLFERYAESERFYHTLEHIDYCLEVFDQVSHYCDNPDSVELAIWFHDAVYDFPIDDNERLSAEYFMDVTRGKLPEDFRKIVFDQVIVTDHRSAPVNRDQKILIDIDLSSFGRPWERFLSDGVNVRREMSYLSDEVFYGRQIAFMKSLLDREQFYATPWFQDNYENTARQNLSRYLDSLAGKGYAVN